MTSSASRRASGSLRPFSSVRYSTIVSICHTTRRSVVCPIARASDSAVSWSMSPSATGFAHIRGACASLTVYALSCASVCAIPSARHIFRADTVEIPPSFAASRRSSTRLPSRRISSSRSAAVRVS